MDNWHLDVRDKELQDRLVRSGIPVNMAYDIVDSLQDASSWNTYAYSQLEAIVEFLEGKIVHKL